MNKLERDGKVAVVISPGHGAGWSTWNDHKFREILCMDAEIAQAVLDENLKEVIRLVKEKCNNRVDVDLGEVDTLRIEWLPKGERFEISEYDGHEEIVIYSDKIYMTA